MRSHYLSSGYWNDDALTAQKFHPEPDGRTLYRTGDVGRLDATGRLHLLGRGDDMVKVRGYRVELGATERALSNLASIEEAAVVVRENKEQAQELCAFVVPAHAAVEARTIRNELRSVIAPHQIPARFVFLSKLPLNSNGKTDIAALPELDEGRRDISTAYIAPASDIEVEFVQRWEALLDTRPIGIWDSFFDLGGSSLAVLQLISDVEADRQVNIKLELFLREPTVANLVRLASGISETEDPPRKIARAISGETTALTRRGVTRSSRLVVRRLLGAVPYPVAARICSAAVPLYARRQRTFVSEVERFYAALDTDVPLEEVVSKALLIRLRAAIDLDQSGIDWNERGWPGGPTVDVEGDEFVAKAKAMNQGVIFLTLHSSLRAWRDVAIQPDLAMTATPDPAVSGEDYLTNAALYSRSLQLAKAREVLRGGGQIVIAGDGLQGPPSEHKFAVHNRQFDLRTGFAELALLTGACVLPVFEGQPGADNFLVRIGPPLDAGAPSVPHPERVALLLAQYISFVSEIYSVAPWTIRRRRMLRFAELPLQTST